MTTQTRIPILDLRPQVEALLPELLESIEKVLRSTHYINGPSVQAFEQEAAGLLGVKHAVGLNSGTDALVIALRALGIGAGDEVITSPFTFFATAEAISHVGAKPVFVDVDPVTMNLDPDLIEAALSERTRAILPVHLFGQSCDMAAIMGIANRHQLHVVEDCAQSFGARFMVGSARSAGPDYKALLRELSGRHTGSIGTIGAFSFFPSKNLGAVGDGGLLTTDDDGIADRARMLRAHGSKTKYRNEILGYNSRLDELQAAILLVKLPYVLGWNFGRRCVAEEYHRVLSGHDQVRVPSVVQGHVFHQYTIQVPAERRDLIQARLAEAGIDTMIYYPVPCHKLPVYQTSHAGVQCPNAEQLAGQVISLPIWPEMSEDLAHMVAETVLACLEPR